jgi:hypothetical protein
MGRHKIFSPIQLALQSTIWRRHAVMFVNPTWFYPAVVPAELPIGLEHLDSDFCWCDPIIDVDEHGQEIVLHRQVTWN